MRAHAGGDERRSLDADLAELLSGLVARSVCQIRLARILNRPSGRRHLEALSGSTATGCETWHASPLGRPTLSGVWREVSDLTDAFLRIEPARLRDACEHWTGSSVAAEAVTEWLFGANGVRPRAVRTAAFLADRRTCLDHPTPDHARALAQAAASFAADLRAEAHTLRRALRELRARARAQLDLHTYGFGEISRPVGLVRRSSPFAVAMEPTALVYKRLAPFTRPQLAELYVRTYHDYNRRLRDEVGIVVPAFGHGILRDARGRTIIITTQAALDPRSIGKALLLRRDAQQCRILFDMILAEYRKLVRYDYARRADGFTIGIDGQITNWAVRDYAGDAAALRGDEGLFYIDTNTPMMRTHDVDCLPLDFYLQALPRLVRPLLRPLARGVLDRYFNPRTILLDFLANTSIHGRPDLVDVLLPPGNEFLGEGLITPSPRPITKQEIERYITSDVMTWRLTRSLRQVEEMFQGEVGPREAVRCIRRIWTQPIF